jgi:hypothetical protein
MDKLEDCNDKLMVFPQVEKVVAEGNYHKLNAQDKEIFDGKEEKIMEEIEGLKKKEEAGIKEKGKAREGLYMAEKNLKNFCATEFKEVYAFEKHGRYYKVGVGALALTQKKGQTEEEMGRALRKFLVEGNELRRATFETILDLLRKYHGSLSPGAPDQGTIMELMNEIRDNPKMSRTMVCSLLRRICDAELQSDLVRKMTMWRMDPDYAQDLDNSIDPETENLQLLMQGRKDFQKKEQMRRKMLPYRAHLSEAEREKFGLNFRSFSNRNFSYQHRRRERKERTMDFRKKYNNNHGNRDRSNLRRDNRWPDNKYHGRREQENRGYQGHRGGSGGYRGFRNNNFQRQSNNYQGQRFGNNDRRGNDTNANKDNQGNQ